MEEEKKYVPASVESIVRLRGNMRKTIDSCYREMYVDMVMMEALKQGLYDVIEGLDKDYLDKLLRVHANVAYAHLCICVQMRASLKASLNVEKQYNIRRCVVTAHEMYKYLYGFTGRSTPWKTIEDRIRARYEDECNEIEAKATLFRERYVQNEDGTLRNVAKHYSDNPVEFFENMEKVNERVVTDRMVAFLAFSQPIHALLSRELDATLGLFYAVAMACPMPRQVFELTGLRKRDDIAELSKGIEKYSGIVESVMAQMRMVKKLESQYGLNVSESEQWKGITEDNVGLHILYIYLDSITAFRAFTGSETFPETRQNLAYMILLAHEGFKKLYGFNENKKKESFWHRAVKDFLTANGDEELTAEATRIEETLDRLAGCDILKDEEMIVAYTHVGTIKKCGVESPFAVLDYFRQTITPADLNPLLDFLRVMNDIVRLYTKVMGLESEKIKTETNAMLSGFLEKINFIDKMAAEHIVDAEQRAKWQEASEKMKALLASLMN